MPSLNAHIMDAYRSVDTSHRLAKIAEYYSDDLEVKEAALRAKFLVDAEVFQIAKVASAKSELGRAALKGLAYGAAPVAGAGVLGYSLLNKAKADAAETTEDIRNKVLQTGLGLAAIGGGLYGLKHMVDGGNKEAADHAATLDELTEKLAAVGRIEDKLSAVDFDKLSPEAKKLAFEVRAMNMGYGVQLLHEAMHGKDG